MKAVASDLFLDTDLIQSHLLRHIGTGQTLPPTQNGANCATQPRMAGLRKMQVKGVLVPIDGAVESILAIFFGR